MKTPTFGKQTPLWEIQNDALPMPFYVDNVLPRVEHGSHIHGPSLEGRGVGKEVHGHSGSWRYCCCGRRGDEEP